MGGDQRHCRAAVAGGFGDGEAHLAAGAVADVADGVDRFASAAGRDDDVAGAQGAAAAADGPAHGARQFERLQQTAQTASAAGQPSLRRTGDQDVAGLEQLQIGLDGGLGVHDAVHGGGDDERSFGGEGGEDDGVVADAVGELGDGGGAGGGDDHGVGASAHGDVLFGRRGGIPEVGRDFALDQAAEAERGDEARG